MDMKEFYGEINTTIQNVVNDAMAISGETLYKPTMNLRFFRRRVKDIGGFHKPVLQQQWIESYPDFDSVIKLLKYDSSCEMVLLLGAMSFYDKKYGRGEKWIDVPIVEED